MSVPDNARWTGSNLWQCPRCHHPTLVGWSTDTMEGCSCETCGYQEGPHPI